MMRSGDWAWCALGVGVVAYEAVAPRESCCPRRSTAPNHTRPWLTNAVRRLRCPAPVETLAATARPTHPDRRLGPSVSAADDVTNAIQRYLDTVGDGWTLDQHVIVAALQRLNPQQEIENIVWYYVPADQPSWQTAGLLDAALLARLSTATKTPTTDVR